MNPIETKMRKFTRVMILRKKRNKPQMHKLEIVWLFPASDRHESVNFAMINALATVPAVWVPSPLQYCIW